MKTITYDVALAGMQAQVQKMGGDYVYETDQGKCAYFHNDNEGKATIPGCIIGHWMHDELGIKNLSDLEEKADGITTADVNQVMARRLLGGLRGNDVISISTKALSFFRDVQRSQDCRFPWGHAVSEAAYYAEISGESDNV